MSIGGSAFEIPLHIIFIKITNKWQTVSLSVNNDNLIWRRAQYEREEVQQQNTEDVLCFIYMDRRGIY